ncbi:MAG: hypothetical protein NT139_00005 [Candidatus Woesearchaeota archaeon]|nr:hypothetical protein [Candidatus Woesearchaeota archaeon]
MALFSPIAICFVLVIVTSMSLNAYLKKKDYDRRQDIIMLHIIFSAFAGAIFSVTINFAQHLAIPQALDMFFLGFGLSAFVMEFIMVLYVQNKMK